MRIDRYSVESTNADLDVDLSLLAPNDINAQGLTARIADFDIEVVGNDAVVTVTAKGSFSSSDFMGLDNGTFPISGGKSKMSGFCVTELRFSRTGTTAYTINITRRIEG